MVIEPMGFPLGSILAASAAAMVPSVVVPEEGTVNVKLCTGGGPAVVFASVRNTVQTWPAATVPSSLKRTEVFWLR